MTAPTPHDLLMILNDALADGNGAMIILIEMNAEGRPMGLQMRSTPITPRTTADIAEFVVERALAHCEFVTDGSADAPRQHLVDALHSLQAASGISDAPTIGRA